MRRDEGIFECLLMLPLWAQTSRESETQRRQAVYSVGW